METQNNSQGKVLLVLLKEPFINHTATSLANALGITRQGVWKSLKRLVENKLIIFERLNKARTSAAIIKINWKNPITEKTFSLLLTKKALEHERWLENFAKLDVDVIFLLLFGSIINNPKKANDIDIILIAKNKQSFNTINTKIMKIQQTQFKKIHNIDLTKEEFISELKKQNKAYLDAVKKGVILYGQENFIDFVKNIQTK